MVLPLNDSILKSIKSPDDLKKLDKNKLYDLCSEIRECLLETVSNNGGHLASNLGVVELTVAIHSVFDSPSDSIIFDVGHQCYTHKLLTGRYDEFSTLRKENGISGFMRPSESEYDPVITGHSSSSISAAYGICKGNALQSKQSNVVAIVGDGAMTGGMVYEALNNAGRDKNNLIVILNDNKMSISRNVGALARQLSLIRTKPSYHRFKHNVESVALRIPIVGSKLRSGLLRSKNRIKSAIYNTNIFEGLGFNYMGPVDGHDIKQLIDIMKIAKQENRPVIIHALTIKGKGYELAELSPRDFHGVGSFDLETGFPENSGINFSAIFGETLSDLASKDEKICAVTAAMSSGTGLTDFEINYKNRFFDVGIAEQHAVTFCAGLAKSGLKPVLAVYSSFLQRGYDQIIHDVAIEGLPVTLCVDRSGFVGEDGETHQGLFDVSFLSSIPGVKIFAPSNYDELENMLSERLKNPVGIAAIRYPRGSEPDILKGFCYSNNDFDCFGEGSTAIVSYGTTFADALIAKKHLSENGNNDIVVVKLNVINPLSDELINTLKGFKSIYFFEEGIKNGGVAQRLGSTLIEHGFKGFYKSIAVEGFVAQATVSSLKKKYYLDSNAMIKIVSEGEN
ncbi:MAG: 1-deoxy-D-xylulose-5-phosphate synthase [Oscillospiraceae bacterium]|nr:1-deoxy-D-xylulose-5-phosphate synthase [Oscillospiraceae bacterium]